MNNRIQNFGTNMDGPAGKSPPQQRREALGAVKTVLASDLFNGAREVLIEHESAIYRLRITRQGKLILNK